MDPNTLEAYRPPHPSQLTRRKIYRKTTQPTKLSFIEIARRVADRNERNALLNAIEEHAKGMSTGTRRKIDKILAAKFPE